MKIIPAVDILNGQVVRLRQGVFQQSTVYDQDPEGVIKKWLDNGAELVHVVDLNGAKGEDFNTSLINDLVKQFSSRVQIAGGIKSLQRANELLSFNTKRVVIGTAAANQEAWVKELLLTKSEQVVIALDIYKDHVRTNGWLANSSYSLNELLSLLQEWGAHCFIITDITKDGMRTGPNTTLYSRILLDNPTISLIASGGVGCPRDLEQLRRIGVSEVIVGKALYTGEVVVRDFVANGGYCHDN